MRSFPQAFQGQNLPLKGLCKGLSKDLQIVYKESKKFVFSFSTISHKMFLKTIRVYKENTGLMM
jgi:hypothetical protein